jgi:uncharacterized repeat protein (TIGR02543 family)
MAAKVFEVGDVLPATTQLRISWGEFYTYIFSIYTQSGSFLLVRFYIDGEPSDFIEINNTLIFQQNSDFNGGWISPYTDSDGNHAYIDIDTSSWPLSKRTVSSEVITTLLTWEDLNASSGYSITFEENGGTTISDIEEATELPTPLPTPTKSGYTFVAWYYESNFQTRAKAGDTIESNVTLYAKWHNLGSLFTEIADAIRSKDGTSENIRDVDFGERIRDLEVGGAELPSTAGGSIFTGATIPLTYKNNTHDYENNYEYKSATHNITITGLDGRATITGNGTKNVLVAFDVTSSTSSLKNFTITCVNGEQELTYKGLHAHYGETVTGILTFAYNNITHDGSEGTFDTSGLTANYKFIVTSSSDLPIFSEDTTLWNTIYSHQLLNVLMGNFSGTSIGDYFMSYCYAFNQPLTLPSSLSSIGDYFMSYCYAFNQPLTLPSSLSSIGSNFMQYCYAFNQPLTLPSGLSSISTYFMYNCYAFNQPLTLPSGLSSIGGSFMYYCYTFNQPLTLPSGLSSIGGSFMYYCYAFNQPLTLPSGLSSIGGDFMSGCYAFNQPLTLPSGLSSIGGSFMSGCYTFNQPLTLPSGLSSIGGSFMSGCRAFNQPLTLPSSLSSISTYFMYNCYAFNQPLTLPSSLSSIGSNFMQYCYALSTIIWNASVYPTDNNSLSQSVNTKTDSTYGAGIKVYGTKRAQLISALPNRTSSPYRKLINGGS